MSALWYSYKLVTYIDCMAEYVSVHSLLDFELIRSFIVEKDFST